MRRLETIKEKIKNLYKIVFQFITDDIWNINLDDFSRLKARIIRDFKVIIITLRHFSMDRIGLQAVALSYFATLAFIPFIAVIFTITNGFGLDARIQELLYLNFSGSQEIVDYIIQFANNIIDTAQSGPYGVISFLVFVWLIIWLMLNVERAFNEIWKVEKSRRIGKRIVAYFSILVLSPLILVVFLATPLLVSDGLNLIGLGNFFSELSSFVTWLIFFFFVLFLFSAIYKFIPNVKVPYRIAFNASLITSVAFIVLQVLYMETQLFVSRLNSVYGVFAAIPLFMIWINFAWFIILFGAELSYAFEHVDNYNVDNYKIFKK